MRAPQRNYDVQETLEHDSPTLQPSRAKSNQRIVIHGFGFGACQLEIEQIGEAMGDDALLLTERHNSGGFEIA